MESSDRIPRGKICTHENVSYVKHHVSESFPCRKWQAWPGCADGKLRKITLCAVSCLFLSSPQGKSAIRVRTRVRRERRAGDRSEVTEHSGELCVGESV